MLRLALRTQRLKAAGVETVDTVADATHIVTDKIHRTAKLLCAVALGRTIVDVSWAAATVQLHTVVRTWAMRDDRLASRCSGR